jgi:hypothetical protein
MSCGVSCSVVFFCSLFSRVVVKAPVHASYSFCNCCAVSTQCLSVLFEVRHPQRALGVPYRPWYAAQSASRLHSALSHRSPEATLEVGRSWEVPVFNANAVTTVVSPGPCFLCSASGLMATYSRCRKTGGAAGPAPPCDTARACGILSFVPRRSCSRSPCGPVGGRGTKQTDRATA